MKKNIVKLASYLVVSSTLVFTTAASAQSSIGNTANQALINGMSAGKTILDQNFDLVSNYYGNKGKLPTANKFEMLTKIKDIEKISNSAKGCSYIQFKDTDSTSYPLRGKYIVKCPRQSSSGTYIFTSPVYITNVDTSALLNKNSPNEGDTSMLGIAAGYGGCVYSSSPLSVSLANVD